MNCLVAAFQDLVTVQHLLRDRTVTSSSGASSLPTSATSGQQTSSITVGRSAVTTRFGSVTVSDRTSAEETHLHGEGS